MKQTCIFIIALLCCLTQGYGYSPVPLTRILSPHHTPHQPSPQKRLYYRSTSTPSITTAKSSPLFSSAASSNDGENSSSPLEKDTDTKSGIFSRFKGIFVPKSAENMSTKELFAKMGMSALLSYGFVSNMSYCVTVSLAYFAFTTKVQILLVQTWMRC